MNEKGVMMWQNKYVSAHTGDRDSYSVGDGLRTDEILPLSW